MTPVSQPNRPTVRGRVRLGVRTAAAATALSAVGCGGIAVGGTDSAQVRFVNLSVSAPAMDLYLNGAGTAYDLTFGTVTSYIPIGSGEVKVQAMRANTAQVLGSATGSFTGTHAYTVVASNVLGSLQETVYPDATGPAPAKSIALRVLDEGAESGAVDVYLLPSTSGVSGGVAPAVRGIGYAAASAYVDLPAGQAYAVAVTPTGMPLTPSAVLHGISVSGGSGAVRTLVLSSGPGPGEKGLAGFVLNDYDAP